jgi:hypothetical protein
VSTLLTVVAAVSLAIPGSQAGWQRVRFDDSAGERAFKALSVVGDDERALTDPRAEPPVVEAAPAS